MVQPNIVSINYIWYSYRLLAGIALVSMNISYLQFQTEVCFWCQKSDVNACQLFSHSVCFVELCLEKWIGSAVLGTWWYNLSLLVSCMGRAGPKPDPARSGRVQAKENLGYCRPVPARLKFRRVGL